MDEGRQIGHAMIPCSEAQRHWQYLRRHCFRQNTSGKNDHIIEIDR